MSSQPPAARAPSHPSGCVGFWLWAVAGAGLVLGVLSLGILVVAPVLGFAYLLQRRSGWQGRPVRLGLMTGAGLPLVLVAALHWNSWHSRVAGDNTPNPYDWGGVGLVLVITGITAYSIRARRT